MTSFTNWAKTYSCKPSTLVKATSVDQVLDAIELAVTTGRKLRVVGTGHSPSDIACCSGILVNTDGLDKVVSVDVGNRLVTVEAGIKLKKLNQVLDKLGLALPNLGSISEQSIAGAISTGTHGTGIGFGILASCITRLVIATSDATLRELTPTETPTLFSAALCSLGCLGVIVEVTLCAVDAFQIKFQQFPIAFDALISNFRDYAVSADYVRFWWFPHTPNCIIWQGTRTTDIPRHPPANWLKDKLLGVHLYELSLYLSTFVPSILPLLNKRYFEHFFRKPVSGTDKSFKVFNFDCLFSQYVTEWAIEWEKAPLALTRIKKWLEDHPDVVAHCPVEIRFVKGDDVLISPAEGHDTCFVGIIMYRPYGKSVPFDAYWKGYESIMNELGGRPHWAKAHPLKIDDLLIKYPKMETFLKIRRMFDPTDMFVNDYIQRHLLTTDSGVIPAKL